MLVRLATIGMGPAEYCTPKCCVLCVLCCWWPSGLRQSRTLVAVGCTGYDCLWWLWEKRRATTLCGISCGCHIRSPVKTATTCFSAAAAAAPYHTQQSACVPPVISGHPSLVWRIHYCCGASTIGVAEKKDQSRCVHTYSKEGWLWPAAAASQPGWCPEGAASARCTCQWPMHLFSRCDASFPVGVRFLAHWVPSTVTAGSA